MPSTDPTGVAANLCIQQLYQPYEPRHELISMADKKARHNSTIIRLCLGNDPAVLERALKAEQKRAETAMRGSFFFDEHSVSDWQRLSGLTGVFRPPTEPDPIDMASQLRPYPPAANAQALLKTAYYNSQVMRAVWREDLPRLATGLAAEQAQALQALDPADTTPEHMEALAKIFTVPRHTYTAKQAICIARRYRAYTFNENWPEIQRNNRHNEQGIRRCVRQPAARKLALEGERALVRAKAASAPALSRKRTESLAQDGWKGVGTSLKVGASFLCGSSFGLALLLTGQPSAAYGLCTSWW